MHICMYVFMHIYSYTCIEYNASVWEHLSRRLEIYVYICSYIIYMCIYIMCIYYIYMHMLYICAYVIYVPRRWRESPIHRTWTPGCGHHDSHCWVSRDAGEPALARASWVARWHGPRSRSYRSRQVTSGRSHHIWSRAPVGRTHTQKLTHVQVDTLKHSHTLVYTRVRANTRVYTLCPTLVLSPSLSLSLFLSPFFSPHKPPIRGTPQEIFPATRRVCRRSISSDVHAYA